MMIGSIIGISVVFIAFIVLVKLVTFSKKPRSQSIENVRKKSASNSPTKSTLFDLSPSLPPSSQTSSPPSKGDSKSRKLKSTPSRQVPRSQDGSHSVRSDFTSSKRKGDTTFESTLPESILTRDQMIHFTLIRENLSSFIDPLLIQSMTQEEVELHLIKIMSNNRSMMEEGPSDTIPVVPILGIDSVTSNFIQSPDVIPASTNVAVNGNGSDSINNQSMVCGGGTYQHFNLHSIHFATTSDTASSPSEGCCTESMCEGERDQNPPHPKYHHQQEIVVNDGSSCSDGVNETMLKGKKGKEARKKGTKSVTFDSSLDPNTTSTNGDSGNNSSMTSCSSSFSPTHHSNHHHDRVHVFQQHEDRGRKDGGTTIFYGYEQQPSMEASISSRIPLNCIDGNGHEKNWYQQQMTPLQFQQQDHPCEQERGGGRNWLPASASVSNCSSSSSPSFNLTLPFYSNGTLSTDGSVDNNTSTFFLSHQSSDGSSNCLANSSVTNNVNTSSVHPFSSSLDLVGPSPMALLSTPLTMMDHSIRGKCSTFQVGANFDQQHLLNPSHSNLVDPYVQFHHQMVIVCATILLLQFILFSFYSLPVQCFFGSLISRYFFKSKKSHRLWSSNVSCVRPLSETSFFLSLSSLCSPSLVLKFHLENSMSRKGIHVCKK